MPITPKEAERRMEDRKEKRLMKAVSSIDDMLADGIREFRDTQIFESNQDCFEDISEGYEMAGWQVSLCVNQVTGERIMRLY